MSVVAIGPVAVDFHGNPKFSWDSAPTPEGQRSATVAGMLEWDRARQIAELAANSDRRVTIGRATGVLDLIWSDDELLREFNGWYLIHSCSVDAEQSHSLSNSPVPFTIAATYLGDHVEPAVARSAREMANDYEVEPQAVIALPFWADDVAGGRFITNPGGSYFTREYDPTSPHDTARLTATDGEREMGIYAGDVAELALVALPDLEASTDYEGQAIPRWLTDRGGDCRAFDRRSTREVLGPSHPFTAATDIVITNGLLRVWVGSRGLPPYLHVWAFTGGAWREAGYLHLTSLSDAATTLRSARLAKVTPDSATIVLALQDKGECTITLRRGARSLVVRHGSDHQPVTTIRHLRWSGLPPTQRAVDVRIADGVFDSAFVAGADPAMWDDPEARWDDPYFEWDFVNPDLVLLWPPAASSTAWSVAFRYVPARAVADLANGAGLLTIRNADDVAVGWLKLDPADDRFKFTLGATTIQSAVQTFDAGDELFICVSFSKTAGTSLSIGPVGSVLHVSSAAVDPGAERYGTFQFATNESGFGEGGFGDDPFGGEPLFPNALIDNAMILADWLSTTERETLAAGANRLAGLPNPEARLVWFAPFDVTPLPKRSTLASGRLFETTADGGAVRNPDDWGLTKAVAVLTPGYEAVGLSISGYGETFDAVAYLATTAAKDDLEDHHEQFAAASDQQVRVRS